MLLQVQTIVQKKDDIMQQWTSGRQASNRKVLTARRTIYSDLNEKMWQKFLTARAKNIPVSGRMLQDQASILALELGHDNFTASNGWLRAFQERYGIRQVKIGQLLFITLG